MQPALAVYRVSGVLIWRHICMQDHLFAEKYCSMNFRWCYYCHKIDAKRDKFNFHLYSDSIWILKAWNEPWPPESPLTPPPPFPQPQKKQKVNRGPRMKLGRRLHHVQVLQISRIPSLFSPHPPHPWKLMGSFWFSYGDSTVREPPSGFLLTWVRCEPVSTAR